MVINVGALKSGDTAAVRRELDGMLAVCHAHGAIGKVIIETALLSDDEKITACELARDAGADFVKTSTGFASAGATVADVALVRRTVGPGIGIKAAGGIRDLDMLLALIAAGATRIGSSASVRLIAQARARQLREP